MKTALMLATIAVLGAPLPAARAQGAADARFAATTLEVSGHGEAKAPPDEATVELGVEARARDAAGAQRQASAAIAGVIAAVRGQGIDARDLQTTGVGLSPQFANVDGQAPRVTGYVATNRIEVTVEDLGRVGAVLDAAVEAGATSVGDVELGLKNRGAAEAFARLAAVKSLEDKAQAYATAAGYRILRLVSLSEGGAESPIAPLQMRPMAFAAARAVPIEAGQLTVGADVTGEFELAR